MSTNEVGGRPMRFYDMQLQIQDKKDIPFFIQQLRHSGFQDPVTEEQNNYNFFLESLLEELVDWNK
jgi:hypothetical protein